MTDGLSRFIGLLPASSCRIFFLQPSLELTRIHVHELIEFPGRKSTTTIAPLMAATYSMTVWSSFTIVGKVLQDTPPARTVDG